jgi:prepilin-type processing-associated H-X9-DG protein
MYRNAAATILDTSAIGRNTGYSVKLAFIRPDTYLYVGSAAFKTDKAQSGRAVASDDCTRTKQADRLIRPGQGAYVHRDGYNVLYGDGSAAWYGDPQQVIQYVAPTGGTGTSYSTGAAAKVNHTVMSGMYQYQRGASAIEGWQAIWHSFDLARGIDQ